MAGGVAGAPPDPTMKDLNVMVNDSARIPKDPAVATAAHGTGVNRNIPLETSVAKTLRALDTTLHRQIVGGQVPPSPQRLPVSTPPPATVPKSRNELP